MPTIRSTAADIHYEVLGQGSPVLLIAGLGGVGASWGPQIGLFAERHTVIVPDHRGTGKSTHTKAGQTIAQHAADFAAIVEHLGVGPVHFVGSSTGGAATQALALEHPGLVKTATLASSWARADPFFLRQFKARPQMLASSGVRAANEMGALFLFDPRFQTTHQAVVKGWVDAAKGAAAPDIAIARIDMILAQTCSPGSAACVPGAGDRRRGRFLHAAASVRADGGGDSRRRARQAARRPFLVPGAPAAFHHRVQAFFARHPG